MSLLSTKILLEAYKSGIFPMAKSRYDERILWIDPQSHGVLLPNVVHIPQRLLRTLKSNKFEASYDVAFDEVVHNCATTRSETWMNDEIIQMHTSLHLEGYGHSVEVYQNNELVGGLYGIKIGGAFFGESMFSKARDASKVALCYLVANLKRGGFLLLDTQFVTEHLRQFGVREIPRRVYLSLLQAAIISPARWDKSSIAKPELLEALK